MGKRKRLIAKNQFHGKGVRKTIIVSWCYILTNLSVQLHVIIGMLKALFTCISSTSFF